MPCHLHQQAAICTICTKQAAHSSVLQTCRASLHAAMQAHNTPMQKSTQSTLNVCVQVPARWRAEGGSTSDRLKCQSYQIEYQRATQNQEEHSRLMARLIGR